MSPQQPDFDLWANSNQPSCGNQNWLAVAGDQADDIGRAAIIITPSVNS